MTTQPIEHYELNIAAATTRGTTTHFGRVVFPAGLSEEEAKHRAQMVATAMRGNTDTTFEFTLSGVHYRTSVRTGL